jgi:hypothetical protein
VVSAAALLRGAARPPDCVHHIDEGYDALTRFTSPIRRFCDVITHRQLAFTGALRIGAAGAGAGDDAPKWCRKWCHAEQVEESAELLRALDERHEKRRRATEALLVACALCRRPQWVTATVQERDEDGGAAVRLKVQELPRLRLDLHPDTLCLHGTPIPAPAGAGSDGGSSRGKRAEADRGTWLQPVIAEAWYRYVAPPLPAAAAGAGGECCAPDPAATTAAAQQEAYSPTGTDFPALALVPGTTLRVQLEASYPFKQCVVPKVRVRAVLLPMAPPTPPTPTPLPQAPQAPIPQHLQAKPAPHAKQAPQAAAGERHATSPAAPPPESAWRWSDQPLDRVSCVVTSARDAARSGPFLFLPMRRHPAMGQSWQQFTAADAPAASVVETTSARTRPYWEAASAAAEGATGFADGAAAAAAAGAGNGGDDDGSRGGNATTLARFETVAKYCTDQLPLAWSEYAWSALATGAQVAQKNGIKVREQERQKEH